MEALTPNGSASAAGTGRPLVATLKLHAGRFAMRPAREPALRVSQGELVVDLDGQLDAHDAFHGAVRADGRATELARADAILQAATLTLRSTAAQVAMGRAGQALEGGGPFTLQLTARGGRLALGGVDVALAPLQASAAGRLALGGGTRVRATGALQGGGELSTAAAEHLARTALGAFDPQGVHALATALRHVSLVAPAYAVDWAGRRGVTLGLPQGARATMAGGGGATLAPLAASPAFSAGRTGIAGGFDLALRVQGLPQVILTHLRYRRGADGALSLSGAVSAHGDAGPVQGGDLSVAGAIDGRPEAGGRGGWRLTASDCARLSAHTVRLDQSLSASDVAVQACPEESTPLATFDARGWTLRTELRQVRAALPGSQVAAALASAHVVLAGHRGAPPSGAVTLRDLALRDTGPAPSVQPLTAGGELTLARGELAGRLALALTAGSVPLGALSVDAHLAGGRGEATLDTGVLQFAKGGLQPGAVTPAAARLLPQVQGPLQLLARIAWSPAGLVTSGEVRSDGFSYRSPAGQIDGVRGDVRLASLAPLASASGQTLAADRLETLVPLTQLHAGFTLTPQALMLQGASADVAGGTVALDPMSVPLVGGEATTGVLRLHGVDLQTLIGAFNLANAVSLQARVDGALPFALHPAAGGAPATLRLTDGRVYAQGPGRLTIRRQALAGAVATAGAAGAQPNAVQDFAYQALEDLAFTKLEADVASRPKGRLGVIFHVVGRHEPKLDTPTRIGLFALLRGHAFDKPLPLPKGTPVDLTLDTSLNLDDILSAYGVFGGAAGAAEAASGASGSARVQP